ncbi:probable bacteriophage protein STY1063 [Escherichia coli IS25]|nr:probable bacteriophage protein STY1063 [Escherichia coli IS25]
MEAVEIPLVADNQTFATTINGTVYQLSVIWRGEYWVLDLADSNGSAIISGIPMITGADLLAQYRYMNLGFSLVVLCDVAGQERRNSILERSHTSMFSRSNNVEKLDASL